MPKPPAVGTTGSPLRFGVRQAWWWLPTIVAVFAISTFRIETIICRVGAQPCPPAALEVATRFKNRVLLWPGDTEKLTQELGASGFSLVKVTRELPHTLRLNVEVKSIAYGLAQTGVNDGWVVNEQGRAFPTVWNGETSTPVITTPGSLATLIENEAVVPSLHLFLLELTTALRQSAIPVSSMELQNNNLLIINLGSGGRSLIDSDQPKLQVQRLELLLQARDLEQLPSGITEFDVRYKLPVIRTTSQ